MPTRAPPVGPLRPFTPATKRQLQQPAGTPIGRPNAIITIASLEHSASLLASYLWARHLYTRTRST